MLIGFVDRVYVRRMKYGMSKKHFSKRTQRIIAAWIFLGIGFYMSVQFGAFMALPRINRDSFRMVYFFREQTNTSPYISFLASIMASKAAVVDRRCITDLQEDRNFMVKLEILFSRKEKNSYPLIRYLWKKMSICLAELDPSGVANISASNSIASKVSLGSPKVEDFSVATTTTEPVPTEMIDSLDYYHSKKCLMEADELSEEIQIDFTGATPELSQLEEKFKLLQIGGVYPGPAFCRPRQHVAVIIPYRNRTSHLMYWLHYSIPTLIKQQLQFTIFVAEQLGDAVFNKGQLMNTAFLWASSHYKFDCYIFHDVDMIPLVPGNFYQCAKGRFIHHLAPYIDKFNYTIRRKFGITVGGAIAFKEWQYRAVNGYSNLYWGWGAEDDDMYIRIKVRGMSRKRPVWQYGRYKMVPHEHDHGNPTNDDRFKLLRKAKRRLSDDGLSTLRTEVLKVTLYPLFTHILVHLPDHVAHLLTTTTTTSSSSSTTTTSTTTTSTTSTTASPKVDENRNSTEYNKE